MSSFLFSYEYIPVIMILIFIADLFVVKYGINQSTILVTVQQWLEVFIIPVIPLFSHDDISIIIWILIV